MSEIQQSKDPLQTTNPPLSKNSSYNNLNLYIIGGLGVIFMTIIALLMLSGIFMLPSNKSELINDRSIKYTWEILTEDTINPLWKNYIL